MLLLEARGSSAISRTSSAVRPSTFIRTLFADVGARYVLDRYLSLRFDYGWQLRPLPGKTERGEKGALSITLS